MTRWLLVLVAVFTARLGAQVPGAGMTVPEGYRPPPGMCRIWIDAVPPDRQPAPTDCATAVRRRPQNAKVIFGDLSKDDQPATASTNTPNNSNTNGGAANSNNAQPAQDRQGTPSSAQSNTPKGAQPQSLPVSPPQRQPMHVVPPTPRAQSTSVHTSGGHPTPASPSPAPKGGGRPPGSHGRF